LTWQVSVTLPLGVMTVRDRMVAPAGVGQRSPLNRTVRGGPCGTRPWQTSVPLPLRLTV
jgi:hypothetical protein